MKDAAEALGVSEPAVSQALASLRQQLGDQLVIRNQGRMTLTEGGTRLLSIASQMVALGAEAESAVRDARGAPGILRVAATSMIVEFVATPLLEGFGRRFARSVEGNVGVAAAKEMPVLLHNRLTDLTLGPYLGSDPSLTSEPVFRGQLVAVGGGPRPRSGGPAANGASGGNRPNGSTAAAGRPTWLVDPSGTDPLSETSRLLRRLRVPEDRIRVYASQSAAWAAAADGAGIAIALAHLVAHQVKRGELSIIATPATPAEMRWHATTLKADHRLPIAGAFLRFMATAEAMHLMRSPGMGVPPSRFRPPVYVTIWS